MNNDILPPNRPPKQPPQPSPEPPRQSPPPPESTDRVSTSTPEEPLAPQPPNKRRRLLLWSGGALLVLLLLAAATAFIWYNSALQPVDSEATTRTRLTIEPGSSPDQIGQLLKDQDLIRSSLAFDIHTRINSTQSSLQAGSYSLIKSSSTPEIVGHLTNGQVDQLEITFLPGATVDDHRDQLLQAGYQTEEVDAALNADYSDHALLESKPGDQGLEGYIYGETYHITGTSSVQDILTMTFDEYYQAITDNNLLDGFQEQGLSLYQAINLASIVQREDTDADDQKQIAQIFLKRLEDGMNLGADPTYKYAAEQLGVSSTPEIDSPYNTRIYGGLPPGPIASPGLSALQAVADPASGDYLYFVSGDDNVNYYSHTYQQHQQNIEQHCQQKCQIL